MIISLYIGYNEILSYTGYEEHYIVFYIIF